MSTYLHIFMNQYINKLGYTYICLNILLYLHI